MSSFILLFGAVLSGQVGQGAFDLKNQMRTEIVTAWVRSDDTGQWLYNKQPITLRPSQSVRLNLPVGRYKIYLRTQGNSTLVMNRQLAKGEIDRLRVGDPAPPPGGGVRPAAQFVVHVVRDDYGNTEHMKVPPMELPTPPPPPRR